MITVMVSGKFDPVHEGHIDHILKAAALGDKLIVVTHTDEVLDKIKPTGHQVTLWARMVLLRGILLHYGILGDVMVSVDPDANTTETLRLVRPHIYAKGGDRTPNNMPQEEIDACMEMKIPIVYGIGCLLNASSKIKIQKEEV